MGMGKHMNALPIPGVIWAFFKGKIRVIDF